MNKEKTWELALYNFLNSIKYLEKHSADVELELYAESFIEAIHASPKLIEVMKDYLLTEEVA